MRRTLILAMVFALVAGLLALGLTATPLSALILGMGQGSPRYAQKWRQAFLSLPDPETAENRYPEIAVKRYRNEEWVFGVCEDSHSSHWGGTVIVKDSTGRVRAFFGHVCGQRFLAHALEQSESLQDFYGSGPMTSFGFREYEIP
jgi:hypothetical protein